MSIIIIKELIKYVYVSLYLTFFCSRVFVFWVSFYLILFLPLYSYIHTHCSFPNHIHTYIHVCTRRKRDNSILTQKTDPSSPPHNKTPFYLPSLGLEPFESTSSQYHHEIVYLVNPARNHLEVSHSVAMTPQDP